MRYDLHGDLSIPKTMVDFLNYITVIQGKSYNTASGYRLDLIMMFRFLKIYKYIVPSDTEFEKIVISDINENFLKTIDLKDLYAFISFTENYRKNGSLTRARKVASIKAYFTYLHKKIKIIESNPSIELETPKGKKKNPVYLTLDESKKLLNAAENHVGRNQERDFCILTFFLNTGMRLSELCSIKINNIKGDILVIVGKGQKERTVHLNNSCIHALEEYLKHRDKIKREIIDEEYLFISEQMKCINKRTVARLVKKFIEKAGLDSSKYTPHKLRHSAATLLYKYGKVDIRSLQKILGHENISTTTIYTHVDDQTLREAVNKNPLNVLESLFLIIGCSSILASTIDCDLFEIITESYILNLLCFA